MCVLARVVWAFWAGLVGPAIVCAAGWLAAYPLLLYSGGGKGRGVTGGPVLFAAAGPVARGYCWIY